MDKKERQQVSGTREEMGEIYGAPELNLRS
jgi:hypothetical protein